MFSEFTVIIPAHNRPKRLKRLLDYLLSYNCKIVVADSSKLPFEFIDEYKNHIIYIHTPNIHLSKKILGIKKYIKTPYVVMCADDDFVIPSSIKHIVDFLNTHNDYSSGQGLYLRYNPINNCELKLDYPWMLGNSLEESTPEERLEHLMKHYYQFYYAVTRTECFFKSYETVYSEKGDLLIDNLCILELFNAQFCAINGKHYIANKIYCLREYIPNSCSSYIPSYYHLIKQNNNDNNLNNFRNLICIPKGIISSNVFDKSMSIYLSEIRNTRYLNYFKELFERTTNLLKIKVNKNILNKLHMYSIYPKEDYNEIENIISYIDKYYNCIYK